MVVLKYAVIIIFKNGMKLDKVYDKEKTAREAAKVVGNKLYGLSKSLYFNHTYFTAENVLCVTWQEVKENA